MSYKYIIWTGKNIDQIKDFVSSVDKTNVVVVREEIDHSGRNICYIEYKEPRRGDKILNAWPG